MGGTPNRYTVAVDVDGVLHSYTTPWISHGELPDPPVEGAIEWLNELILDFDVVIFSTRGATEAGRAGVWRWLVDHGYTGPLLRITDHKPPALLYVDDRGFRFDGVNFPTPGQIRRLRPWHK